MSYLWKVIRKILDITGLSFLIRDFKNIFTTPEIVYDEMDYDKYWEHRTPTNVRPRFLIMRK